MIVVTINVPGGGSSSNPDITIPTSRGPAGPPGQNGTDGTDGVGVPVGGTTGQVLGKASGADYDTEWVDQTGGGGGSSPPFPISDITGLQTALDTKAPTSSPTFTGTVSGIDKGMVGLGSVDNTSDASKPVSTATQTALDGKQPLDSDLTSIAALTTTTFGRNQLTYADASAAKTALSLAKADVGLSNVDNTSDAGKPVSTATQTALDLKAPIASPTFTGTVSGVTPAMVGLGNVTNTSDANKPVSTAQQTALNLKADLASPTFTGTVTLPSGQVVNGVTLTTGGGTSNFLRADGTYAAPPGGGGAVWGAITGTLSSQTDLNTALTGKAAIAGQAFTGAISATNLSGTNTGDQTITLTSEATGSGTGSFAVTLANSAVIGKVLTGYTSGAGTVAATDTILGAIQKLNGNDALKAPLASPTFTGTPAAPTATAGNSTTQLATTAFVTTADNLKANLASPTFTGTPAAPTAVAGTSTTQLATTAFVTTADNLKANIASPTFTGTVGGITAAMVGLGNVTNTSDANKPVSTAQQTALDLKANLASPTFTGTVGGITKSMVGLSNVDNTADTAKPVSTAQQTALDLKANLASPTFTGTVTLPAGQVVNGVTLTTAGGTTNFLRADGTYAAPPGGGGASWGSITGTLSSQTDLQSALDAKAPLASPALTGTPTAPTATAGTNTTQVATTAFVLANAGGGGSSFIDPMLMRFKAGVDVGSSSITIIGAAAGRTAGTASSVYSGAGSMRYRNYASTTANFNAAGYQLEHEPSFAVGMGLYGFLSLIDLALPDASFTGTGAGLFVGLIRGGGGAIDPHAIAVQPPTKPTLGFLYKPDVGSTWRLIALSSAGAISVDTGIAYSSGFWTAALSCEAGSDVVDWSLKKIDGSAGASGSEDLGGSIDFASAGFPGVMQGAVNYTGTSGVARNIGIVGISLYRISVAL